MDYLAEVEERIKHKIEQIEEEMDNRSEVGSLKVPFNKYTRWPATNDIICGIWLNLISRKSW